MNTMSNARAPHPHRSSRGVGLIEVMIAMVILAFGMLLSTRAQVGAIASGREDAAARAAGVLLEDIAERMLSNPEGVAAGDYDARSSDVHSRVGPSGRCVATWCTASELADVDVAMISRVLAPPGGAPSRIPPRAGGAPALATIERGADDIFTITLTWGEGGGDETVDRLATLRVHP